MKKNIALLISIVALILFIVFFRVNIVKEEKTLKGNLISDAIYGYDLKTSGMAVNGMIAKEENIYYLLMEVADEEKGIYNYELKKLNIYQNKVTTIASLNEINSYCSLKEENIYCSTSKDFTVYDLELKETFSYTYQEESLEASYVPYKDIYIKIENNEIYLIRNKEETLYRQMNSETPLLYDNYYITDNNTYIIFLDEFGYYYLYDINENKLINTEAKEYIKYDNGIFVYDINNLKIYDLINEKTVEYENQTQETYYYTGTLNKDNTIFYLYDIIENKLYIENALEGTIQELDTTTISQDNPIARLLLTDHYLYVYVLQDELNFYVIDLEKLDLPITNMKEYNDELTNKINQKINEIDKNYNVNINIKEDAIIKFPDFYAEAMLNNEQILESLAKIDTILAKYDLEFFNSFYENGYTGLNLYLTGSLTPSDYETQASNPAAYSLTFNGEYMIVIDLNQPNIEELLCHELLHNLEFNLNNQSVNVFNNWNTYNPTNFIYNNSYTADTTYDYTLTEENKNNVYFIDYYSHTYETEDRARVFEKICSCTEDSIVKDYPHLYEKGLYLESEITKYYPSLANTGLFNSLN